MMAKNDFSSYPLDSNKWACYVSGKHRW